MRARDKTVGISINLFFYLFIYCFILNFTIIHLSMISSHLKQYIDVIYYAEIEFPSIS